MGRGQLREQGLGAPPLRGPVPMAQAAMLGEWEMTPLLNCTHVLGALRVFQLLSSTVPQR